MYIVLCVRRLISHLSVCDFRDEEHQLIAQYCQRYKPPVVTLIVVVVVAAVFGFVVVAAVFSCCCCCCLCISSVCIRGMYLLCPVFVNSV